MTIIHNPDGGCSALDDMQAQLDVGGQRMDRIEAKLDSNSKDTAEILDILNLGKSFFRAIGYFGAFLKWSTAIAAPVLIFWYTLRGGGKP